MTSSTVESGLAQERANRQGASGTQTPAGRRAALSLALAITPLTGFGNPSPAATVDTPVCRAHLDQVGMLPGDAAQRQTADAAPGLESECAAMHDRVRTLLKARNVYRRCTTGLERQTALSMIEASIDDTANRISARCAPRSADVRTD